MKSKFYLWKYIFPNHQWWWKPKSWPLSAEDGRESHVWEVEGKKPSLKQLILALHSENTWFFSQIHQFYYMPWPRPPHHFKVCCPTPPLNPWKPSHQRDGSVSLGNLFTPLPPLYHHCHCWCRWGRQNHNITPFTAVNSQVQRTHVLRKAKLSSHYCSFSRTKDTCPTTALVLHLHHSKEHD